MDLWAAAKDRAKELVNLPDLDAMAADDDYIHTESLNVSKTRTTQQQQQQQQQPEQSNLFIRQDSVPSQHPSGHPVTPAPSSASTSWTPAAALQAATTVATTTALEHVASSSSWSLLDRKATNRSRNSATSNTSSLRVEEATARLNAMVFDTAGGGGESSSSQYSSSQRNPPMSAGASVASQTQSMSEEEDGDDDDDDDDDASQDSYDENDPILPLIQQQSSSRYNSSGGTKSARNSRFMNDLDQRLAQPSVPESQAPRNPLEMENDDNDMSMPPPRRLWPWQKPRQGATVDSNSNKHNTDKEQDSGVGPLWARPKKKKYKPATDQEPFILVSSGNLGFSEEEKQALANLQQTAAKDGGSSGNILSDHPRESFVVLTLVLGAAVYFFSRLTAADDIAL